MELKKLNVNLTVCKVKDYSKVNFDDEFLFIGKTDEENSLVCNTKYTPSNTTEVENGWLGFRIQGVLDFSLIGILAEIASLLASNNISIYAISTFNTDYILLKAEVYEKALTILSQNNYTIV